MALLTNINFTDPQGTSFTGATFGVSQAAEVSNENIRLERDLTDLLTMKTTLHTNKNITVQYYYWPDEESRLTGSPPYTLANVSGSIEAVNHTFNFAQDDSVHFGLTLEEKCLHYLQNVILV